MEVSEENNILSQSIEVKDFLMHINLDIDNENILDYIYNSKNSFCLSQLKTLCQL